MMLNEQTQTRASDLRRRYWQECGKPPDGPGPHPDGGGPAYIPWLEALVAQLEAIKEACELLFEKDDDGLAKYIKVEGEGDTWWIPEAIGLKILTALNVGENEST